MLRNLYRYRRFIWQHALADLRFRYAGSGMGALWNILHPLALIAIYAVIFGSIMGRQLAQVPGPWGFTLYLCAGFFPWVAFSECVNRSAYAMLGNASYLKRLPVPEYVFVAQSVTGAAITLVVSYLLFAFASLLLGARPSSYWLLIPLPAAALLVTGFGLGLMVGTLNVFFSDTSQILGILLQILFWLTPIVYLQTQIKSSVLSVILRLSPVTPAIEAIHSLFIWHRMPALWTIAAMIAWAAASLMVGAAVLKRLRGEIRDVI